MKKKTKKNPKGSGRPSMYKPEFGKVKRISVSVPSKKETEIKVKINDVLKPYFNG